MRSIDTAVAVDRAVHAIRDTAVRKSDIDPTAVLVSLSLRIPT